MWSAAASSASCSMSFAASSSLSLMPSLSFNSTVSSLSSSPSAVMAATVIVAPSSLRTTFLPCFSPSFSSSFISVGIGGSSWLYLQVPFCPNMHSSIVVSKCRLHGALVFFVSVFFWNGLLPAPCFFIFARSALFALLSDCTSASSTLILSSDTADTSAGITSFSSVSSACGITFPHFRATLTQSWNTSGTFSECARHSLFTASSALNSITLLNALNKLSTTIFSQMAYPLMPPSDASCFTSASFVSNKVANLEIAIFLLHSVSTTGTISCNSCTRLFSFCMCSLSACPVAARNMRDPLLPWICMMPSLFTIDAPAL